MMADYLDLTRTHAPVVIIAVLLVGAALSVAAQGRASWVLAVMASAGAAVVALDMAWRLLVLGATQAVVPDTAAIGADGVGAFAAAVLTVFGLVTLLGAAPPTIAAEPRASAFDVL